ncbi:MAG: hypothetical protein HUK02_00630 [Bacteroidaceae bacterium]|nr:hypothetical protein [Bacteroidaceae bacterium]
MTDQEVFAMQQRIDQGIRLAHQRLIKRAIHDNLSLIVYRDGAVRDIPANEF